MIPFDVAVALAVLVILGLVVLFVIRWGRGGIPYEDGLGETWVTYVPEPEDPRALPRAGTPSDPNGAPAPQEEAKGEEPSRDGSGMDARDSDPDSR
jgi:hypothetical protein